MYRFSVVAALLSLMLTLSACDRIEAAQEARAFARSAVSVTEQRARVLGDPILGRSALPGTVFEAVPTSGSATYQGAAFLGVRDQTGRDAGFVLVGDTTATLNWGTSAGLCPDGSTCATARSGKTGQMV